MEQIEIDGWLLEFDRAATIRALDASQRGAHECSCNGCRNFVAARDNHYAQSFLQLLHTLGVQPHKEAEVSEFGPSGVGRLYCGFYHFVGRVLQDPGDRMSTFQAEASHESAWRVFFTNGRDLAPESFGQHPLVQLEFQVELPWVLEEPPPT